MFIYIFVNVVTKKKNNFNKHCCDAKKNKEKEKENVVTYLSF